MDNKKLAMDIASKIDFQPMDDRILIKPLKPIMITKLLPTPPKEGAKSMDELETMEPTEPTKQRVEANIQKGIILKLGTEYNVVNTQGFEVGDIVYFWKSSGMPFDLLKDSRLLKRYEVLGIEKYEANLEL